MRKTKLCHEVVMHIALIFHLWMVYVAMNYVIFDSGFEIMDSDAGVILYI